MSPAPPAVYRMYDAEGGLLYVGCSVEWPCRFASHTRTKAWWTDVRTITCEYFADITAARSAEWIAQQAERPRYCTVRTSRGLQPGVFYGDLDAPATEAA